MVLQGQFSCATPCAYYRRLYKPSPQRVFESVSLSIKQFYLLDHSITENGPGCPAPFRPGRTGRSFWAGWGWGLHAVLLSGSYSRHCGRWDDKTDGGHPQPALSVG